MAEPLIRIVGASKIFTRPGLLSGQADRCAVDRVTLSIERGEILGIVGESGSGKSTLLRMIMRLLSVSEGRIEVDGRDIATLSGRDLKNFRRQVQPVFQNPASSFNPRQTIGTILKAPLEVHGVGPSRDRPRSVVRMLEAVGLSESFAARYPHQLSGGEKQRIAIARAVILSPAIVLADEPTSALDVSVQAQILNIFADIRREMGLTAVFVSHDLGVIRQISDQVAVMRAGQIVECGPADMVFSQPRHDYTRALLSAVPVPKLRRASPLSPSEA